MLLILADHISNRLRYTCDFIFKEQFGIEYILEENTAAEHDYFFVLNYSAQKNEASDFFLKPSGLLAETGINEQSLECLIVHDFKIFFAVQNADLPFDILSAVFYLLSRYEEYLPHEKDMYGRYAYKNSLAYKEGFLEIPLIDYWLHYFKEMLQNKFPGLQFRRQQFSFIPTYDIDIAYSYKGKGLLRNIGGFIQSPGMERIAVNIGAQKDPYDAYEFLHQLHNKYSLRPIYFFLLAKKPGKYDKNLSPQGRRMTSLLQEHCNIYQTGMHPSWESYEHPETVNLEKKFLENACKKTITQSRQHYIRFNLPETFRKLVAIGITDEYSMGYGSINGFRASVTVPFYWYDLEKEATTKLRLHPFCYMDANSFFEEKLTPEQSAAELLHYYTECKKVNGQFISIFHNNFLGTEKMFSGYREMYQRFINEHFFVEG